MSRLALVVYDLEGYIESERYDSNPRIPVGLPYLWVTVPDGKRLSKIDLTGIEPRPVLEDAPKNELTILQETVEMLVLASLGV
ncbi:MAG: hypothetical protein HF312_17070 [Ignavibacteria bacterium]|jgi:hypothetical protein|nr:hypothetical protein [Ignavibacteria bacterium]